MRKNVETIVSRLLIPVRLVVAQSVTTANVITPTNEVILTFVVEAGHRGSHK